MADNKIVRRNELGSFAQLQKQYTDNADSDLEQRKANKDGAYEGLLAGTALNLQGQNDVANSSGYRTAGGSDDIATGLAEVDGVRGNAIAWNQLVKEEDAEKDYPTYYKLVKKGYDWQFLKDENHAIGASQVVNPNLVDNVIAGHKYLIHCNKITNKSQNIMGKGSNIYGLRFGLRNYDATKSTYKDNIDAIYSAERDKIQNTIFEAGYNGIIQLIFYHTDDALVDLTLVGLNVFDLTLIYGAGKEPATAEEFEADYQRWFGKALGYEEYDEGSLRNVKATGIKTVGFNLYGGKDLEGANKDLYAQFGLISADYLWKNDCGYKGQIYASADIEAPNIVGYPHLVFLYTDGTAAGNRNPNTTDFKDVLISEANKTVAAVAFSYANNTNDIVKVKNICINFSWSGKRDGEFEPHWEEEKSLPLTKLKGRLGGEGESVVVFPDGMKRAGSVYDEIKVENGVVKAIKRVGSVDLGELTWNHSLGGKDGVVPFHSTNLNSYPWAVPPNGQFANGDISNILCAKFHTTSWNELWNGVCDKAISLMPGILRVRDDTYPDAAAFKAAMKGVMLYYELAEPQEYVLEDDALPLAYKVDDFGTEQVLGPQGSVAPTLMTRYGINAVDTLRRLPEVYLSKEDAEKTYLKQTESDNLEKRGFIRLWTALSKRFSYINFVYNSETELFGFTIQPVDKYLQAAKDYEINDVTYDEAINIFSSQSQSNMLTEVPYYGITKFNIPPFGYNTGSGRSLTFERRVILHMVQLEVLLLSATSLTGGNNIMKGFNIGLPDSDCATLKAILCGITPDAPTAIYASNLELIFLPHLKYNVTIPLSSKLRIECFQAIVEYAQNTSPITVSVHADVYAKLTDPGNAEWFKVATDAAAKNISFASA